MKNYFSVLARCPLFEGIEEQELGEMLRCLNVLVRKAWKGQAIFREGEPAQWVGIVLEGGVQILRDDYDGSRSVLGQAAPGQLFGEAFACAGVETLPVTVLAEGDSTVMLADCRRALTLCPNACPFHARLVRNLLQVVAEKNLRLNRKIECMSRRTTREKIMAFLLAEARERNSREFDIPFDRQALADYLGVERSAMSAQLSRLRREGVIDCQRSHFRLL